MDERRTGWLLILLLAGQLVFLGIHGARKSSTSTYAERFVLRLVGPVAHTISAGGKGLRGLRESVEREGSLRRENAELRREVEALRLKQLRLDELQGEVARLGAALPFASAPFGKLRSVDVVYADHTSWMRTLILFCGDPPARPNQPVLVPEGLVGRVVAVAGRYAKVQLVTDRSAAVGAMLVRTGRQGVARGSGNDSGSLDLDYVPLPADVRPGERVLTAGIDGIYPRGIPLGAVVSVAAGGQLFHKIRLAPAADFGSLVRVYLLESTVLPEEVRKELKDARH